MNGDIFTFFLLISVMLTFHGTEAQCRSTCRNICRHQGDKGQNCCSGTDAGYGRNGQYDPYCREGTCDLVRAVKYVPSLKFLISPFYIFIMIDSQINDILYFLRICRRKYVCRDLDLDCDDGSSEEHASGKL